MKKERQIILQSQLTSTEEFEKMSIKEKRLCVIQDALDSVIVEIITPDTGNYISSNVFTTTNFAVGYFHLDIKSNPNIKCSACELGTLLISTCRFSNQLEYGEASKILFASERFKPFNKLFSKEQVFLMESCFEGSGVVEIGEPLRYLNKQRKKTKKEVKIFDSYVKTYPEAKDRMIAMFINMIRNDGIFIPKQDIKRL